MADVYYKRTLNDLEAVLQGPIDTFGQSTVPTVLIMSATERIRELAAERDRLLVAELADRVAMYFAGSCILASMILAMVIPC